MAKIKVEGIDGVIAELKKLEDRVGRIPKTQTVNALDLLDNGFLRKHSRFGSVQEFLEASGFGSDAVKAFDAIPKRKLNACVRKETEYKSWDDMVAEAAVEKLASDIGL